MEEDSEGKSTGEAIQVKTHDQIEKADDRVAIEVKNLIISDIPREELVIGSPRDIVEIAKERPDLKAIIWNEEALSLLLGDRSMEVRFELDLEPIVRDFFTREQRRHYNEEDFVGTDVWEGDFKPVRFTKRNLLKFISNYEADVPIEVKEAIKSLTLKESRKTDSILLAEDDGERTTEEEKVSTNLPKHFTLDMPLAYGIKAKLEFEATVIRDQYGKGRPTIELQCVNGRKVLSDLMQTVIEQFPARVPRYYGKLNPPKRA